jgi:hypothetical protein
MPGRLLAASLLLCAPLVGAGCGTRVEIKTPVDDAALARMTKEGEAALRDFGKDLFDVVDFKPAGRGHDVSFSDDFDFRTHWWFLDFDARVRWKRDFQAKSKEEMEKRLGAPDWTMDESWIGLEQVDVLGEGPHKGGTEETIQAAAVFSDLQPGWRFERLDARRAK